MYTQTYSYTYQDCQDKHDDEYVVPGQSGGGTWGSPGGSDFVAFEGWGIPENRISNFCNGLLG
jgi:hypothetical protein